MMNENQKEIVEDIITFFQRLGASNELSDRNFDTGDLFSEEYCNFIFDLAKKYGLYDEAWKAIYQYVFALAHGASEIWYYSDWIKTQGVAIVSCNDGLRPVIMKLEATEIEALPEE